MIDTKEVDAMMIVISIGDDDPDLEVLRYVIWTDLHAQC